MARNKNRLKRPHVLICGSRNYPDLIGVASFVRKLPTDTIIVTGNAKGVDQVAAVTGRELGIAVLDLSAPWACDGNSAGPVRNIWMLDLLPPGAILRAFWDGSSRGTKHMVTIAKKRRDLDVKVRRTMKM